MSRILLVYHEPVQRQFLASFLTHAGFEVVQSANAEEACRLLQAQEDFDALLIDLDLPGVSGWECCRFLRHDYDVRFADVPMICVSSRVSQIEGERVTAYLSGQAYIALPVEPVVLRQVLVDVLAGKRLVVSPRVLFVGDQGEWWGEEAQSFQQQGWVVETCQRVDDAQSQVAAHAPDLLVIYRSGKDISTLDWVSGLKSQAPFARIVLVTADHDPQVAIEAITCGIHEFIREPLAPGYLDLLFAKSERARVGHLFAGEDRSLSLEFHHRDDELKKFLLSFDEIVILTDGDGLIVNLNEHGKKLLQWTTHELLGQRLAFLDPSGTSEKLWAGENTSCPQETTFRTQDGRTLEVLVSTYPILGPGRIRRILVGKNVHELALARDEIGRLRDQVNELEDLKAMEMRAGGIAHDVNNILMAIQGHASLLTYKGAADISKERPAEVILQAAHRGQELTAQLLGKARRGKERRLSIDLQGAIEEVLALLSENRLVGIHVSRDYQAHDSWITVNARQWHQVVLNLIVNACDAMPKGGHLMISTISHQAGACIGHQETPFPQDPFVELIITDTGCGIPKELQGEVFKPFFSTKPPNQGSGMGLAIVKDIVEAQGGHMSIVSEVNRGTAFHLCFAQSQKGPQSSLIHLPTVLGMSRPKILVVDDEPLVLETTVEMLRLLGCESVVAHSGEEAMALYRNDPSDICAIVLDLTMPSMSGEACHQALRAINPSVKIVFASGMEGSSFVQQQVDEGLAGFVQKPFDVEDLSLVLKHVFLQDRQDEGYALSGVTSATKEGL